MTRPTEGSPGHLDKHAAIDDAIAGIPAQVATIAVPRWTPSTVYAAGQMVTLPTGDNATAISAHTSGPSTYTPANWALSTVLTATFAPLSSLHFNVSKATFPRWRTAVAKVRAGTSSAKLLCVGDSTTWGSVSGAANPPLGSAPAALAGILNQSLIPAVPGLCIPGSALTSDVDTRWSPGGWTKNPFGFGTNAAYAGAVGATALTFTPGVNVDTFDVWYLQLPGQGTVQASVDGGANTPVVTSGAYGIGKATISTTPASTHVLTLGTITVNTVFVIGIDAYLSTSRNVRVGNAGVGSSSTAHWQDSSSFGAIEAIKAYAPDLTWINLGINDAIGGVPMTSWRTNLQAVITAAKLSGDVMIESVVPSQNGTYAALEQSYRAASLALAISNGCGYFDKSGYTGDWATFNALGLITDSVHPNRLGYADIATAMATTLRVVT